MRIFAFGLIALAVLYQSALADPDVSVSPEEEAETLVMLKAPVPSYPSRAISKQIQGMCVITFDVTAEGDTENIQPSCTNKVFCKESKRAISRVRFPPALDEAGEPVGRKDVSYPLEFRLAGVEPDPKDWSEPTACFAKDGS